MAETKQSTVPKHIDYYKVLTLFYEILMVHLKFWYAYMEAIVKMFLPQAEMPVDGQVVLITGAGHGIGKEVALQYGSHGAKVICWDINEKTNKQTVKEIQAAGGKAYAYTCNVTKREEINELAAKIKEEHGFIGIVINNAGIMPCHPLLQHTDSELKLMYDINVLAHFWIIQAFLPDMMERNEGSIVAISSCAGLVGVPNLVPYCGTKFAVRGIMQALTEELRLLNPQSKIKLTTIYPYMVDTGLCKRPYHRFPNLMKMVDPRDAAVAIMHAQRTGMEEVSIPRHFLFMDKIGRFVPKKAIYAVTDFLHYGVDSDL